MESPIQVSKEEMSDQEGRNPRSQRQTTSRTSNHSTDSQMERQEVVSLLEVEKIVLKMMEEKNREFEKKMEVNQPLIDSLVRENMRKESLLESQKSRSSSYRAKTDQPRKWRGTEQRRTTRRFLKEVEHWCLTNDVKDDVYKIRTLSALLEGSALDWFDGKIKANSNYAKETAWCEVCEKLIGRFESKWQNFVEGLQLLKLRQEAGKTSLLKYVGYFQNQLAYTQIMRSICYFSFIMG